IVGISKTTYVLATPRWLEWRRGLQRTGTNTDPSHSWDPRRRPAGRPRGDRRGPRPPVAGVLVLEGRTIHRRPSRLASWSAWRRAARRGVAGGWPGRRPNRTVADPGRPEPARGFNRQRREGVDGLSRAP